MVKLCKLPFRSGAPQSQRVHPLPTSVPHSTTQPGPSRCVPWELSCDRRPDVTEWGGATGGSGPGRGDPHLDPSPGPGAVDVTRDAAGRALDVAARAAERNANGVAFSSKEVRRRARVNGEGGGGGWSVMANTLDHETRPVFGGRGAGCGRQREAGQRGRE